MSLLSPSCMVKRVAISIDEVLDAYPVARFAPSELDRKIFVTSIRNKKPAIIDRGAHSWFGLTESRGAVKNILENIQECDVDMLIAIDGRNFLKHSLCGIQLIDLKSGMEMILSGENELSSQNTSTKPAIRVIPERRYIRTYFDSHSKLLGNVDLTYLTQLVSSVTFEDFTACNSTSKLSSLDDNDISMRDSFSPFKLKNIGLWTSSEGCVTPLHFDLCHGFLAQIVGKKTFLMASCCESVLLRYWKDNRNDSNENGTTSSIDLGLWLEGDSKERAKHPLVDEVAWYIASLYPGDILYTPPGWWHYVISETASVSVLIPFDPQPYLETLPMNVLTA